MGLDELRRRQGEPLVKRQHGFHTLSHGIRVTCVRLISWKRATRSNVKCDQINTPLLTCIGDLQEAKGRIANILNVMTYVTCRNVSEVDYANRQFTDRKLQERNQYPQLDSQKCGRWKKKRKQSRDRGHS